MDYASRTWPLRAGSCFIFRPHSQPHGTQHPEQRLVVFGVHFEAVGRDNDLLREQEVAPFVGQTVRDTVFFETLAQRCETAYSQRSVMSEAQSQTLLRLMVLQLWEEALRPAPTASDQALNQFVRDIRREPGRHWPIEELAERAHMSRAQFTRRFRGATGLAPGQFVRQARMERAQQLLLETNMSIAQIAYALGYEDVAFFSRQFKQSFGHPPSSVRGSSD